MVVVGYGQIIPQSVIDLPRLGILNVHASLLPKYRGAGPLVEALEAPGSRFVVGLQCHPERQESTPAAFERVFAAFVAAAAESRRDGSAPPLAAS